MNRHQRRAAQAQAKKHLLRESEQKVRRLRQDEKLITRIWARTEGQEIKNG